MKRAQYGQSLIELIVALTLLLVVVTFGVILTVNGLKNSQFSKNQILAAKFAQQGIDLVREIRSKNYQVCSTGAIQSDGLWSLDCSSACRYMIVNSGTCGSTAIAHSFLSNAAANQGEAINADGVIFSRVIIVTNNYTVTGVSSKDIKQLNVIVSWADTSGPHSSNISTILSKY